MPNTFSKFKSDAIVAVALFAASFALYARTLAPSVVFIFDDSLEMQYVVPRLGILHPTGYPLYTLLGKLFTLIVPLNDVAYRLNLFSALCAALTIPVLYYALKQITNYQLPNLLGVTLFAVSRTFWEQAVIAEVYALQMLLSAIILYAALRYGKAPSPRALYVLTFAMGLGFAHHRITALLYPALAIYVFLAQSTIVRDGRLLLRAAIIFLIPLLLYLYLPLRGATGSADGTYENTLTGFLTWTSGAQYGAFFTGNPLSVQHNSTFYTNLFVAQFTLLGLALAAIGIVWMARQPRELTLLAVALIAEAVFAFNYRTADVEVHFLTTFLLLAMCAGAGADGMMSVLASRKSQFAHYAIHILLAILLFLIPLQLLFTNYPLLDMSAKWDVHDYAIDLLAQPTEPNATLIGILGEMTLVRYFQSNLGLHPDLKTIHADKESDRLAAVDAVLAQNRNVYLTRPLKGVAEKYALDSLGPLIRVRAKITPDTPRIANPLEEGFGAVTLLGYAVDESRLSATKDWHAENGRAVRITVYWRVDERIPQNAMVSLKILGKDRRVAGQLDQHPVRDAYPTTAWRVGEIIADTYDVPVFLGAAPGEYTISVTMYDPGSGAVLGARNLNTVSLAPDFIAPRRDGWGIAHPSDTDFGAFALAGYTLDSEATVRPGDALPLTLLWRANRAGMENGFRARVWLEDEEGKSNASRDALVGQGFPVNQWQTGQFVRESPIVRVPANVADGKYRVKLAVARGEQLQGGVPFRPAVADLGFVEIKNRTRVMVPPAFIPYPVEAAFDRKIRLLGYNWGLEPARQVRLTLFWKSLALMNTPYTVFVHLLDAQDRVVLSADAAPEFPTTGWLVDEFIFDSHTIAIPAEVARGAYRVEIGWYDPVTGARLKTSDSQDRVILAAINVP